MSETYIYDPTVKPFISLYILAYNEEILLPHTIAFYKQRFPNSKITILDNESDDNTHRVARELGCEVETFQTQGQISDIMYQYLKNNIWKKAETDWVGVMDCDEWLNINEGELRREEQYGTTIIKSDGYNMVNMENNLDIPNIKFGYRDNDVCQFYDKSLIFNKAYIQEMNYIIGAHGEKPEGKSNYSKHKYKMYHYKYISPDFMVARYKLYASRLSDLNKQHHWGKNYEETEGTIRALFEEYRKKAKQIL